MNIDSLLKNYCKDKDIIVIRIGENVPMENLEQFPLAMDKLIDYCSKYTKEIILTGEYYPKPERERTIMDIARKRDLTYVPIYWIWNLHRKECSPSLGDTLFNTKGKPYTVKGDFITSHPNDKGMELIARTIYNAM